MSASGQDLLAQDVGMPGMLRELTEHLQPQCPDRVASATVDDGVERQPGQSAARHLTPAPMGFLNGRDGVSILEREGTVGCTGNADLRVGPAADGLVNHTPST